VVYPPFLLLPIGLIRLIISSHFAFKFANCHISESNYYYSGPVEGSTNPSDEGNTDAATIENMEEQVECQKKTWQERRERKLI